MINEPPQRRRSGMEWLLLVAAIAVGVPAAAWLAQERLIFFPQALVSTSHLPANAVPLEVAAGDGVRLHGWIVPGSSAPAPAVIYFGGNAEEISWTVADPRWPRAWSVVGVNYRGYGRSEGTPGERTLLTDSLAIYDAVAARDGIDPKRIVVFGRSLGTAMATRVASQRPVAGAVLVSPFDSLAAIGRHHYPWLPVSLLLRHRFDTMDDAALIRAPQLTIVAALDEIIPIARSRALYEEWAGPKRWVEVPGANHNSLGAAPAFWNAVDRFLGEL